MAQIYLCILSFKGKRDWIKIGKTYQRSLWARLNGLKIIGPYDIICISRKIKSNDRLAALSETIIKIKIKRLIPKACRGEWIRYSDKNLKIIKRIFNKKYLKSDIEKEGRIYQ